MSYSYKTDNNQLLQVGDGATGEQALEGLAPGQGTDNYTYDAIGNLTRDRGEGIDNIEWTVYGKVASVNKTDGTTVSYRYDGAGNRGWPTVEKTVVKADVTTTRYIRDATGNITGHLQRHRAANAVLVWQQPLG